MILLRKLVSKNIISYDEIAKITDIKTHATISNKMTGKNKFYVNEVWTIRDYIYEKTGKFYYIEDLFREE